MEFDYTETSPTSRRPASRPPLSVKEIAALATRFDFNPLIPLRYYLRTADTLLKEANIYLSEGDDQQAYLLLVRWLELVLSCLPKHPERDTPENSRHLKRLRQDALVELERLETIQPRLKQRYEAYQRQQHEATASHHRSISGHDGSSQSATSSQRRSADLSVRRNTARGRMERADHALAMEIAREEFEKRERAKREYRENEARKHGIEVPRDSRGVEIRRISTPIEFGPYPGLGSSEGDFRSETVGERKRREALEEEESWEFNALSLGDTPRPQPYQTDNTVDIIDPYDFGGFLELQNDRIREEPKAGRWTGSYPTIPKSRHSTSSSSFISSPTPPRPPKSQYAPAPPPKIPDINIRYRVPDRSEIPVILPPKPPKFVPSEEEEEAGRPFSATASLENGQPLRTLFLPASLRKTFLSIARPNTHANLETCGLLCGSLIRNALFVSRLVIPEQEATSDTCATKDEMGLFDYCDKEDLMVFGWIHTHPTQTCFMSSVDLHTHASYQLMLNESIAVVCAPSKNPSYGIFRLTDPPGVQTIVNCKKSGLFHPHIDADIYTDATRPGHVVELKDMGFEVVDLRTT